MQNKEIEEALNEVEEELKKIRIISIRNKLSFLFLLIFAIFLAEFKVFRYVRNWSQTEIIAYYAGFFLFIFIPALLMPLNSFLSDKRRNGINWKLKSKLMLNEIRKLNESFRLYPESSLPEDILFTIGVMKKGIRCGLGDDFLIGEMNGHRIKISEFHIENIFRRVFDGYVAVIYDWKTTNDFFYIKAGGKEFNMLDSDTQALSGDLHTFFSSTEKLVFVKQFNARVYVGVKGNRNMFEFSFNKLELNNQKYQSDTESLNELMKTLDFLCKN